MKRGTKDTLWGLGLAGAITALIAWRESKRATAIVTTEQASVPRGTYR